MISPNGTWGCRQGTIGYNYGLLTSLGYWAPTTMVTHHPLDRGTAPLDMIMYGIVQWTLNGYKLVFHGTLFHFAEGAPRDDHSFRE